MDPRDDDIQFDFFDDEPATTEAAASPRVRLPRRGGRGTGARRPGGPARGLSPVLRLLALVAVLVALLVIFGLVLQSCASTSKHDRFRTYMDRVGTLARSSQDDGTGVASALITPGAKANELADKLRGFAEQERQNVTNAERLDVPGQLRDEHQHLVESLQLRVSGVQGLAATFAANPKSKTAGEAAVLAEQADRLLASDVVWDDLFKEPANQEMSRQGVSGVSAPESHFLANRELATERSMALLLTRLRGTATGATPSGVHGTNIVATKALPGGHTLSTDQLNTVIASPETTFVVTVQDSGNFQEVGIKVTLTIEKANGAIVKTKRIDLINPGQEKPVEFKNLGALPIAELHRHVNVDVSPVTGEKTASNNKASYPVVFTIS